MREGEWGICSVPIIYSNISNIWLTNICSWGEINVGNIRDAEAFYLFQLNTCKAIHFVFFEFSNVVTIV